MRPVAYAAVPDLGETLAKEQLRQQSNSLGANQGIEYPGRDFRRTKSGAPSKTERRGKKQFLQLPFVKWFSDRRQRQRWSRRSG
jgi:hypothetical protein